MVVELQIVISIVSNEEGGRDGVHILPFYLTVQLEQCPVVKYAVILVLHISDPCKI